MKKRFLAVCLLVCFIISLMLVCKMQFVAEDENQSHFVSHNLDGDYNILEVVTSEKQQKLTYMFSGYEPIDLSQITSNTDDLQTLASITKTFDVNGSRYSTYIPVDELTTNEIATIYESRRKFSQLGWYEPSLDGSGKYKANFFQYSDLVDVYEKVDDNYIKLDSYENLIRNYNLAEEENYFYKLDDKYVSAKEFWGSDRTLYYFDGTNYIEYDGTTNPSVSSGNILHSIFNRSVSSSDVNNQSESETDLVLYYKIDNDYFVKELVDNINQKDLYDIEHNKIDLVHLLNNSSEVDNLYYKSGDNYFKKIDIDNNIDFIDLSINYIIDFSVAEVDFTGVKYKFVPASSGRQYDIDISETFSYIYSNEINTEFYNTWLILDKDNRSFSEQLSSEDTESWVLRNRISIERPVYEKLIKNNESFEVDFTYTEITLSNKDLFRKEVLNGCDDVNISRVSIKTVTYNNLTADDISKADLIYFNTKSNDALADIYLKYKDGYKLPEDYSKDKSFIENWGEQWGSECDYYISASNAVAIYNRLVDRNLNIIYDDNSFMTYTSEDKLTGFQTLYMLSNMMYPNVVKKLDLIKEDTFNGSSLTYNKLLDIFPKADIYSGITYEKMGIDNIAMQGFVAEHNVFNANNLSIFNLSEKLTSTPLTKESFGNESELEMYKVLHNLIFHPVQSYYNDKDIRLLEIQPLYSFIGEDYFGLRIYGIDPYFKGNILVTCMSSKELITSRQSYTTEYDMIYIGSKYDLFNKSVETAVIEADDDIFIKLPSEGNLTVDLASYIHGENAFLDFNQYKYLGETNVGANLNWVKQEDWGKSLVTFTYNKDAVGVYQFNMRVKDWGAQDSEYKSYNAYVAKEGISNWYVNWDKQYGVYHTYLTNSDIVNSKISSTIDLSVFEQSIKEHSYFINDDYWFDHIELDTSIYSDYGNKFINNIDVNDANKSVTFTRNDIVIEHEDPENAHLRYKVVYKGTLWKNIYNHSEGTYEGEYPCYIDIDFIPTIQKVKLETLGINSDYYDDNLDGKIYTHVGDYIDSSLTVGYVGDVIYTPELGYRDNTSKTNDINTRTSGTDILERNAEAIRDFAYTGRPVFVSSMLKSKDGVMESSLDSSSYMYDLIMDSNIISDDLMDKYDFTKLKDSVFTVSIDEYPIPYIDTESKYIDLTDDGIRVKNDDDLYYKNITKYITHGKDYISYDELGTTKDDIISHRAYANDLNITFTINSNSSYNGNYSIKLYSDTLSDGNFLDNEEITDFSLTPTENKESLKANTQYTLTKSITDDFSGIYHWKLIIYRNDNPKITYEEEGYTLLRNKEEKEILNILQIIPRPGMTGSVNDCGNGQATNLNMGTELWKTSGKMYETWGSLQPWGSHELTQLSQRANDVKFRELISNVDDYEIHIWTMSEDVLMQKDARSYEGVPDYIGLLSPVVEVDGVPENEKERYPNGIEFQDFDMIVIGFSDRGVYVTQPELANALVKYQESGKSLVLSHDVNGTGNYAGDYSNKHSPEGSSYYLTELFRTVSGQDRYGVASRYDDVIAENLGTTLDPLNVLKYRMLEGDSNRLDFMNALKGQFDTAYKADNKNDMYSEIHGYTDTSLASGNTGTTADYPILNYEGSKWDLLNGGWVPVTRWATMSNPGQVCFYPYYVCGDIDVSETHAQYWQLNLNDKDIAVWFSLGAYTSNTQTGGNTQTSKFYEHNVGDGQNNYYIYTKGNITYTGFGHTLMDDANIDEMKLYVNTLVMAYRGITSASKLELLNSNVQTVKDISYMYLDYDVTSPTDVLEDGNINTETNTVKLHFKLTNPVTASKKQNYVKFSLRDSDVNDLVVTDLTGNRLQLVDVPNLEKDNTSTLCYNLGVNEEFIVEVDVSELNTVYGTGYESESFNLPIKCTTYTIFGEVGKVYQRTHTCTFVKRGLFNIR